MSKILSMTGVKADAYTYDGYAIYKAKPAFMKEYTHPVVKDSQSASVSGAGSDGTIEFTELNAPHWFDRPYQPANQPLKYLHPKYPNVDHAS